MKISVICIGHDVIDIATMLSFIKEGNVKFQLETTEHRCNLLLLQACGHPALMVEMMRFICKFTLGNEGVKEGDLGIGDGIVERCMNCADLMEMKGMQLGSEQRLSRVSLGECV